MREYAGPGEASVSRGTEWNIGDYVDSAILARAKLLLLVLRVSGQNYLCPIYLPSSSTTQFDLERHNGMGASSSFDGLIDHVYHAFFNYNSTTRLLTAGGCFEYDVELTTSNNYNITHINKTAWGAVLFTFPHIYVFYQ